MRKAKLTKDYAWGISRELNNIEKAHRIKTISPNTYETFCGRRFVGEVKWEPTGTFREIFDDFCKICSGEAYWDRWIEE